MKTDVVVIGGGIAGLEASTALHNLGHHVILIEKKDILGGHVALWDKLFPNNKNASSIIHYLKDHLPQNLTILLSTEITNISKRNNSFFIETNFHQTIETKSVLVATGYDVFNAHLKEEYGYGIYDNVITSAELEEMFKNNKPILTKQGKEPSRIGFVHCVGSRDRKINNLYCSKVCCVTAVKQAIEIRQKLPFSETYCFYMDLRMYGLNFEELYNESQEKYGVTFIRGRLSEASETIDGKIIIKVEDTLLGRPLKMTMDMLVLMVGMVPSAGTSFLINKLDLLSNNGHFIASSDEHLLANYTNVNGVFVAGTASSPKSIDDTFADARSAVLAIHQYLTSQKM
ncbi:MAG: FAD-dependent oxidoreductase [Bacteroidales bacterium]|nr:FAD-dependent oxidoreductase [Bacteroidales bacterium]